MAHVDKKPGVRTSGMYALSFMVAVGWKSVISAGERLAAPGVSYTPSPSTLWLLSLSHQPDSSSAAMVRERRFSCRFLVQGRSIPFNSNSNPRNLNISHNRYRSEYPTQRTASAESCDRAQQLPLLRTNSRELRATRISHAFPVKRGKEFYMCLLVYEKTCEM